MVSPEWRLNLGFGVQKKLPFLLNKDNKYKDYVNAFPGTYCVPRMEVPQRRGSTVVCFVIQPWWFNTAMPQYVFYKIVSDSVSPHLDFQKAHQGQRFDTN